MTVSNDPDNELQIDDSDAPIELDGAARGASNGDPTDERGTVRAEHVSISQGGAGRVDADSVSISQGGAGRVSAHDLTLSEGGVALARTDRLVVNEGGSAFAVMADAAEVAEGANVFLLVSGSTSGDVRPVLDWRAAVALGAGFALVMTFLRRLRR